MFTGIIENMGEIIKKEDSKLFIKSPFLHELKLGDSVAHDGVCLTISKIFDDSYEVELMPETFKRSHFQRKKVGDFINLERSMKAEGRLDGHIVQGHTDFVGTIFSIEPQGNAHLIRITIPQEYADYFVEKGSVTVNGISLTVIEASDTYFSIGIIPHTWQMTNLQFVEKGDLVNIETDILAKYFVKMMKRSRL